MSKLSQDWVGGHLQDTAHSRVLLGHVSHNSEVALLSPVVVPRILHQPVVRALLGAIANQQNSVVNGVAAPSLDNAAAVEFKSYSAGIDTDGHGSELESLSQLNWVKSLDLLEL